MHWILTSLEFAAVVYSTWPDHESNNSRGIHSSGIWKIVRFWDHNLRNQNNACNAFPWITYISMIMLYMAVCTIKKGSVFLVKRTLWVSKSYIAWARASTCDHTQTRKIPPNMVHKVSKPTLDFVRRVSVSWFLLQAKIESQFKQVHFIEHLTQ